MINQSGWSGQFALGKFMLPISNHLLALNKVRNGFQEEKSSRRLRLDYLACSSLDSLSQPSLRFSCFFCPSGTSPITITCRSQWAADSQWHGLASSAPFDAFHLFLWTCVGPTHLSTQSFSTVSTASLSQTQLLASGLSVNVANKKVK